MNITTLDLSVVSLGFALVSVTVSHITTWIAVAHSRRTLEEHIEALSGLYATRDRLNEVKNAADDLQDRLSTLQQSRFSYMGRSNMKGSAQQ